MTTDRELLELAAKAAGYSVRWVDQFDAGLMDTHMVPLPPERRHFCFSQLPYKAWEPLSDDGDRYRLAQKLGINIDFADCCAWKRMPSGNLIQEFWGGDCGDEPHAILRAAAEIGKAMP